MEARAEELSEATRVVAHCTAAEGLHLTFESVHAKESVSVAIADVATAVAAETHPQWARMVAVSTRAKGDRAMLNIMIWRSRKIGRRCNSSPASEVYASMAATAELEWTKSTMTSWRMSSTV